MERKDENSRHKYQLQVSTGTLTGDSDDPSPLQTLDTFLQHAYQSTKQPSVVKTFAQQWKYWCILLSLGVANSSDASEILCLSYLLGDAEFKESILRDRGGGFLAASVFLGMLIGGLLVGTMGDWLGRRPMLLLGLCCNAIAGILSAATHNVEVLIALRCISGLGIGATVPPLFTLATELAPPSTRGLCVTICASFWMVGSIYVALVGLWFLEALHMSWRIFALACAAPSATGALLVFLLVPESPRFLGLEQRSQEATENANILATRMNFHGPPLTLEELQGSFSTSALQNFEARRLQRMDSNSNGSAIRFHGANRFVRIYRFLQQAVRDFYHSASKLYLPNLKRTTLPLQLVWFSISFGSYGLLTWINSIFVKVDLQNVYFNALLFAASNLPGNVITAVWMDRLGRGPMLIGSVLAAALSLVSFAFFANSSNQTGIVTSACAFQCFTIAAWNTIDTMTSELFPTLVRSTGMGICAASGRIGAMVAQFVNGALLQSEHLVTLLLIASATLVSGAAAPFLLPRGGDLTGRPVNDDLDTTTTTTAGMRMPSHQQVDIASDSHHSDTSAYQDHPTNRVEVV